MVLVPTQSDKFIVQGFNISNKKIAIVGCGGLGCNVIAHLTGSGAGTIYLVDFDTVSESNLNRQFLYTKADIGFKKCEIAGRWAAAYSPDTEVIAIDKKIEVPEDLEFAKDCDILILATDNDIPREAANSYCSSRNIPLVCGGIDGFYGMAFLYIPKKTPCLRCAGLIHDTCTDITHGTCTDLTHDTCTGLIHNTYAGSSEDINLQNQCNTGQVIPDSKRILSVSSAAGVIGSLEASLAIRFLTGDGDQYAGFLHVYDDETIVKLPVSPVKQCKFCSGSKLF